jgi:pimeloyl-ACP methyl ester carboxylesterase
MIVSMLGGLAALMLASQPAPRDTVIRFTSGTMSLEGTLLLPAGNGPHPAVVIVAGSGPTDRDGNNPGGVAAATYRMLAEGLAARGIASFRYDKRSLPTSKGTMNLFAVTLADFSGDALAAVRLVKARADIGPVVLLGHSEGGTLVSMAARDGAPVAGLVLVSAVGRNLTTVLREQLARQLPSGLLASFDTAWAGYIGSDTAVKSPAGLEMLFHPANRSFMKSWQAIDPVDLLRRLSIPTLIVHGETDVQTTPDDARQLASARPDVKLVLLPGVNHVLKLESGRTLAEQQKSYADGSLPLAPGVAPAIADFVLALPRR